MSWRECRKDIPTLSMSTLRDMADWVCLSDMAWEYIRPQRVKSAAGSEVLYLVHSIA